MKTNSKDLLIIEKMLQYCDDINELMKRYGYSFDRYLTDISFQYSCGMCLIQLGELSGRISEDIIQANPQIAWRALKAMRNIHTHDYGNIDYSIVWDTLINDIPDLKHKLSEILVLIS